MGYKIIITESAKLQLEEIISYIVNELYNEKAATEFLEKVRTRFNNIKITPYMYEVCRDKRLENKKFRKIVIDNYIMIYKVIENQNNIFIVGIFYSGQEYYKNL